LLANDLGDTDEAWAYMREAMTVALQINSPLPFLGTLEAAANIHEDNGDLDMAVVLRTYVRDDMQKDGRPVERATKKLDALKAKLPEAAFATATARGSTLTRDAVIQMILPDWTPDAAS